MKMYGTYSWSGVQKINDVYVCLASKLKPVGQTYSQSNDSIILLCHMKYISPDLYSVFFLQSTASISAVPAMTSSSSRASNNEMRRESITSWKPRTRHSVCSVMPLSTLHFTIRSMYSFLFFSVTAMFLPFGFNSRSVICAKEKYMISPYPEVIKNIIAAYKAGGTPKTFTKVELKNAKLSRNMRNYQSAMVGCWQWSYSLCVHSVNFECCHCHNLFRMYFSVHGTVLTPLYG